MQQININTYLNGSKEKVITIDSNSVSKELILYLETIKEPNISLASLYNTKTQILDIIKGEDEINTVYMLVSLIKTYPYDLYDVSLYAVVDSAYARNTIGFINKELKFMKLLGKKEKHVGLIKKTIY